VCYNWQAPSSALGPGRDAMKAEADRAIQLLNAKHTNLLAVVSSIPEDQFRKSPGDGAWSVAEILVHLQQMESFVIAGARKAVSQGPVHVPWKKRIHLLLRLTIWRRRKVESPIPPDPNLVGEREQTLASQKEVRGTLMDFIQANEERDFRDCDFNHPFFGHLNLRAWFDVVGWHDVRHTKQIRETVKVLRAKK
jgi:hypothetical protein